MKLKTDYGVPQYILESLEEPALRRMIDKLPKNPWSFYDKDTGFSIKLCERLAEKFKINNSLENVKHIYNILLIVQLIKVIVTLRNGKLIKLLKIVILQIMINKMQLIF